MSIHPIDPTTAVGPVALAARDRRALSTWYGDTLGLTRLAEGETATVLGAADGTPLIVVVAAPEAAESPRRSPGLYHTAILLPSRADLGRFIRYASNANLRMQGAADHLVSEALYLADPEGNGIEIYRDRPRADWPMQGAGVHMENARFDVRGVVDEGDAAGGNWAGMPAGTIVGHVHLKVADLAATRRFYVDILGFDVMNEAYPGALFVAAGGYHHHFGLNVWESAGGTRPPRTAGLAAATITLPAAAIDTVAARLAAAGVASERVDTAIAVSDPSGNRLLLVPSPVTAPDALRLVA